jgi:hypothetical protein
LTFRQCFGLDERHGVQQRNRRGASHGHSFLQSLAVVVVRQGFDQVRVVDHRELEQQVLLSQGQVFVAAHSPIVVLVKAVERGIVSHKQGFTTRFGEYVLVFKVFDNPDEVGEVVLGSEVVINALSQPVRLLVVQGVGVFAGNKQRTPGHESYQDQGQSMTAFFHVMFHLYGN